VIVTTDASVQLAKVHDRKPVLIPRDAHALWLDPQSSLGDVAKLVERAPELELRAVGFGVNDPRKDDETLIAPVEQAVG
jgi:putative SOS response-associated peptidase YedK